MDSPDVHDPVRAPKRPPVYHSISPQPNTYWQLRQISGLNQLPTDPGENLCIKETNCLLLHGLSILPNPYTLSNLLIKNRLYKQRATVPDSLSFSTSVSFLYHLHARRSACHLSFRSCCAGFVLAQAYIDNTITFSPYGRAWTMSSMEHQVKAEADTQEDGRLMTQQRFC